MPIISQKWPFSVTKKVQNQVFYHMAISDTLKFSLINSKSKKNNDYMKIIQTVTQKYAILMLNDARGSLTQKNQAKISEKGLNMGIFGISMKFPIILRCQMFSSLKNLGEK